MNLLCPIKGNPVKVKIIKARQWIGAVCDHADPSWHLIAKNLDNVWTHHRFTTNKGNNIHMLFLKGLLDYVSPILRAQLIQLIPSGFPPITMRAVQITYVNDIRRAIDKRF